MSRFKRFAGRLAMGAMLTSSVVAGTSALATGTASAAPREPSSLLQWQEFHQNFRPVVFLHTQERFFPSDPGDNIVLQRIAIMEGNGHVMLGREPGHKIGSMSLGGGR